MYVLLDIEWYEYGCGRLINQTLTQVAAERVDGWFDAVDSFSSIVKPEAPKEIDYTHMGLRGYKKIDYDMAMDSLCVMSNLQSWLNPDDVLALWHESSLPIMRKYIPEIKHKIIVLHPGVRKALCDGKPIKGSAFHLAKLRGLKPRYPEHRAENDVEALRLLLKYVGMPLYELGIDSAQLEAKPKALIRTKPPKQNLGMKKIEMVPSIALIGEYGINPIDGYCFVFNPRENLFHRVDCPKLVWWSDSQGYASLKGVLIKHKFACECCIPIIQGSAQQPT